MANGTTSETLIAAGSENGVVATDRSRAIVLRRTLAVIAVAGVSAGVAYAVVRTMLRRGPSDPTTERIAALVEEAERLLKQLDDAKQS